MSWTQPQCVRCFDLENPGRRPHVLSEPEPEDCCTCGIRTADGIYVRKDPKTVGWPS